MKRIALTGTSLALGLFLLVAGAVQARAADNDAKIESAARNSYVFKTYLKGDDISVKSVDGAVALTGTVKTDSHKSLAQDTVAELPGVKSVDNRLEVETKSPSKMSDAWIATQIKTALLFHSNVSGLNTDVDVAGGVVTLHGQADSEAQKDLTGEYAKDIEGVKDVHNEIVVTKPTTSETAVKPTTSDNSPKSTTASIGDAIDDASVTALVKLELLTHRSTSALRTSVSTTDGIVTLTGEAKNGAEKDLAAKVAKDVNGVRRVENKMTVKPN